MYTNLDTNEGAEFINKFTNTYGDQLIGPSLLKLFIIKCLKIIMKQNIIKFGDTYWIQKNGAAMGTSCAVKYSFLYIGLLELKSILNKYREYLIWYGRFIDDGLGL